LLLCFEELIDFLDESDQFRRVLLVGSQFGQFAHIPPKSPSCDGKSVPTMEYARGLRSLERSSPESERFQDFIGKFSHRKLEQDAWRRAGKDSELAIHQARVKSKCQKYRFRFSDCVVFLPDARA
jgi:hypothetical protein